MARRNVRILLTFVAIYALFELAIGRLQKGLDQRTTRVGIGSAAPQVVWQSVAAPQPQGQGWTAWRGKVVVVDFWATWCLPCGRALPELQALADGLAGQPVEFLTVHVGLNAPAEPAERQKVGDYLAARAPRLPVYFDRAQNSAQSISHALEVEAVPLTVLLDGQGIVRHRQLGGSVADLAGPIQRLLAAP